jgi:uncharacterized protein YjeT (DUF2065 family)
MSAFDLVLGIAIILVGVLFAVSAKRLITIVDVESKRTQYTRAVGSLLAGIVLVLMASASNSPNLIRAFGVVAVIGGLSFFVLPHAAWVRIIRWLTREHLTFYRVATLIVTSLLGGYIAISGLR